MSEAGLIGTTLRGRYYIVKSLGSGGFGVTYLAEDRDLPGNPPCVVKQLKPQFRDEETLAIARRLFATEAKVLQELGKHEQIPELFAYFEENQEFFLIQEFVDGHPLSEEITSGKKLSESYVEAFLKQVLEPLKFVHQNNVIHRDLKPENLIRRKSDGKIFLIDFGAVKRVSTDVLIDGQSKPTVMVGTPGYMPIEQLNGQPEFCSDIYALGVIAIQALLGSSVQEIPKDNNSKIIWRNQTEVKNKLATVLDKMVASYPQERYQSASHTLQDLEGKIVDRAGNSGTKKYSKSIIITASAFVVIATTIAAFIFNKTKSYTYTNYNYQDPRFHLNIGYPEHWDIEEIEDPITGNLVTFKSPLESEKDTFQEHIRIHVHNLSKPLSLREYQQQIIEQVSYSNGNILSTGEANLLNRAARKVVYSRLENGTNLKQMEVFTVKENTVYGVIYIAEVEAFERFLEVVEKMIEEVEIELKN